VSEGAGTRTEYVDRDGGRLAFDVRGEGPLVVCVPGIGDLRQEYRFLAPRLEQAGFRVASLDLRGHGESSTGWQDLSAEAVGSDILALVHHLQGEHALVVGTSMAAGAAVWAAVEDRAAVGSIVLVGPFVRDVGSPAQQRLYRALFRVVLARPWGLSSWMRYWKSLFPSRKPDDFDRYEEQLRHNLAEQGRFAALQGMMLGPSRREIEARLARVEIPALVVMGTKDRDFKDPAAEARLVAERVRGQVALIEGAGHYPHVEFPEETGNLVVEFARGRRAATAEPEVVRPAERAGEH
jgi:pimeloyl-ACP methyl ester carboxylesterase